MAGTKKTRALELADTESRLEGIPKGGSRLTGMSDAEKASLEVLLATMPMGAALKAVKAAKKSLTPASKTIRKRAKADKVRKKESESRSKTRQKEADKRTKRTEKEFRGEKKANQKRYNKHMADRKRQREGMTDEEKIKLGLLGISGGTYAAGRNAFPDPLSNLSDSGNRVIEEDKKNKGGYVKKYAYGGGVRKVRR